MKVLNNSLSLVTLYAQERSSAAMVFFTDFGIDTLVDFSSKCDFPWLMSNVTDNETGRPLADGKISHVVEW